MLEANIGTAALATVEDLLAQEIASFKEGVRIDVQVSTPGRTFDEAWERRTTMRYHGQVFHVVSRLNRNASKRDTGQKIVVEEADLVV